MHVRIGQIASLQTGIFAKKNSLGNATYFQVRHFSDSGKVIKVIEPDLQIDEGNRKHLLRVGDVIFAAKGTRNIAATYDKTMGPAVASSSFLVLKIRNNYKDRVLPEFLAWYINHPRIQAALKSQAKGSALPSISIEVFRDLKIDVPDVPTQKAILQVHRLSTRERELLSELEELKDQLVQHQLILKTQQ